MYNRIFFTLILLGYNQNSYAKPKGNGETCCLNHKDKPNYPFEITNYECSNLTPFGNDRCNKVYGGNVCKWGVGNACNKKKCNRLSKFELHYGEYIDVGRCVGLCKDDSSTCSPSLYSNAQIGDNSLKIIKECKCDVCDTASVYENIEINVNKCKGECNTKQRDRKCLAGVKDNFSQSNGLENSNPSPAMISGILSGCSAGIQSGFDIFMDNRCFGHTFTKCMSQGDCLLKSANLHICMKAANVFLTNTDSLVLGINGGGLWGQSLPTLNGGAWNQNDEMCLNLDLGNLAGTGSNILLDIQMAGHLDVMVQDDTSVDFLELTIQYEKCQECIPKLSAMSHLYSNGKTTDYINTEDCDCVEINQCNLFDHYITYYEGTKYETTINVGQCLGKCSNYLKCNEIYAKKLIKSPEGSRNIYIIEKCDCGKIPWNPNGLYNSKN